MSAEADKSAQDECTDCGKPIGEARLAAIPTAIRCVGCQGIIENARGRRL